MNYEKKYKEALERAKQFSEHPLQEDSANIVEYIFPELAESEDERIKKELKALVTWAKSYSASGVTRKDAEMMLNWLEKQKPLTDEEFKQGKEDVLWCIEQAKKVAKDENEMGTCWFAEKWLEKQGETYTKKDVDDAFVEGMAFAKNELEKQDNNKETLCDKCRKEQPSHSCQDITANGRCYIEGMNASNNVKPKFKVGDWIIQERVGVYKVIEVCESWYEVVDNKDEHYSISFDKEYMCRLWTIQDAKDGDVLVSKYDKLFIYNGNYSSVCIGSYCGIAVDNTFRVSTNKCNWTDNVNIYPATKEQRDTFFIKMKEAGYEWNAEKKELKKIEQKPVIDINIPFGAKDGELIEASYYIPEGFHAEIEGNNVVIKKGEQKSAWSEEDKKKLNRIYQLIAEAADEHAFSTTCRLIGDKECVELQDFLRSLKPQPRQDWSNEDDVRLQACLNTLQAKSLMGIVDTKMTKWLKSLKQRIGE